MTRYSFRLSDKGLQRGVGVTAVYGEVGWDEELATFYARFWPEVAEEPLAPAHHEPLVSCGERLCEITDLARLERCLAERSGLDLDFDPSEIARRWGERLEDDRDRYMESLNVEQAMNLLFRLRLTTDP
jgi:hypothetical protein